MSDNQQQPGAADTTPDESATTEAQDISQLPAWAQALVKDLRKENAAHRTGKKAAEEAARQAEEKRLADQQEWKTLAEKRAAELDALKPLSDRVTLYEDALKATLAKRLDAIPKEYRSLVPTGYGPVELMGWLDDNQNLFATRRAPNLDGGAGAGGGTQPGAATLTAEEVQIAKRSGMTPEQYAAQKVKIQARKQQET